MCPSGCISAKQQPGNTQLDRQTAWPSLSRGIAPRPPSCRGAVSLVASALPLVDINTGRRPADSHPYILRSRISLCISMLSHAASDARDLWRLARLTRPQLPAAGSLIYRGVGQHANCAIDTRRPGEEPPAAGWRFQDISRPPCPFCDAQTLCRTRRMILLGPASKAALLAEVSIALPVREPIHRFQYNGTLAVA